MRLMAKSSVTLQVRTMARGQTSSGLLARAAQGERRERGGVMVEFHFDLNFAEPFGAAIIAGRKTQTIRKGNKRLPEAGDTLHLYAGANKGTRVLLGTATCAICEPITIADTYVSAGMYRLPSGDAAHIARIDGFASLEAMRDWFRERYGLPFEGYRVMWHGFNASATADSPKGENKDNLNG